MRDQLRLKFPCTDSSPCFLGVIRNLSLFIVQHDISLASRGASQSGHV